MPMFKCNDSEFDFLLQQKLIANCIDTQFIVGCNEIYADTKPYTHVVDRAVGVSAVELVSITSKTRLTYCKTDSLNDMQLAIIKHTTGIDAFGKYVEFIKNLNVVGTSNKKPKFGYEEDAFSMTGAISTKKVEHVRDHVLAMELLSFIASNQNDIESCVREIFDIIE